MTPLPLRPRTSAVRAAASDAARERERLEDELLVLRAQGGERAAFAALVARYQARLWRHAARLTGSSESAWDVLQETWLVLARGLRSLSDPALFRRWVYTIVTRLSLHERREERERAVPDVALDERAAPDDEDEARVDDVARVRRALAELDADQRALLSLRYLEGFELGALAEVLEIPEGTVKSRLHHARGALRARLERMEP